ncbi:DEAD/DEAH box helicase [Acetobacter fallax]|uniref:DEAD/DEAH box helicase n=1 Tax=Acetobacter fallax TaxID=1737473 RepID=A0ABX0KA51_9PROT|nr:DEAD/DEAH box helicase [Acetobacter fallax]NHO31395.1 DEAD/DEAH box helicase [Acetobacter fallax]NHO35023.1 DEAD/DEAH box helicase [Acetobacter fallax]
MTAETPSAAGNSASFDLLHETVRRWLWRQGWGELRDIQERSIPCLLKGNRDLIIAAGTASGKTEAAFLPIVSRLAENERKPGGGFESLYISPLRALINDQFSRIETLCEDLDIPVIKWHGDVAASIKNRARKRPEGILLTTPESLEAMLVRHGNDAPRLFGNLSTIVIDEMHAFMNTERGRQLQSLMNRIEIAAGHTVTRVGLSATLADMKIAAAFLRPLNPDTVDILDTTSGTQPVKLQLRGIIDSRPPRKNSKTEAGEAPENVARAAITRHLFETLRGHRSLIFANSRQNVELFATTLNERCQALGVPEEFFAHHGNLSREHREEAERRLKEEHRPGSIVATTTLELGIDVGHIDSVAQIGPGHTVSGMRQRLGRSGRRAGQSSVMRIYTTEMPIDEQIHPIDALRPRTIQTIAMVSLMLRRWNEPPQTGQLHLSTLVQQILALIAQHGGLTAKQGWQRLVESRVFPEIDRALYTAVLRRMGDPEVRLIEQAPDGTLLPGEEGERLISHRSFYAVFMTPEEFKVVTDRGRTLGAVPVENPILPEQVIIFAGRRWRVLEIDTSRREILVTPAQGGTPPTFGGDGLPPAEGVVAEMHRVYNNITIPKFLDETAITLLTEARETFDALGLRHNSLCHHGDQFLLFPWAGDRAQLALILALTAHEVSATSDGIAITVPAEDEDVLLKALKKLAAAPAPDPVALARLVPDMKRAKYDQYLGNDLLARCYASDRIDASRIPALAADLLQRWP